MTKVFVLADIEGVAGVVHSDEGSRDHPEYQYARRLMTDEASAIVAGILDAKPDAQVTVVDSHGPYRNILPERLHEAAILSRGKPRLMGMMDGIDEEYDAAMFFGVHGSAGQGGSVLSHTFTGTIADIKINGQSHGELGLNALLAACYGVPVILVSGDQHVMADATALLPESTHLVQTKTSRGQLAAESIHPAESCRRLRAAAADAITQRHQVMSPPSTPVTIDISFTRPVYADLAELVDGAIRTDGRSVQFVRETYPDAFRVLRLMTVLCSTPV